MSPTLSTQLEYGYPVRKSTVLRLLDIIPTGRAASAQLFIMAKESRSEGSEVSQCQEHDMCTSPE